MRASTVCEYGIHLYEHDERDGMHDHLVRKEVFTLW